MKGIVVLNSKSSAAFVISLMLMGRAGRGLEGPFILAVSRREGDARRSKLGMFGMDVELAGSGVR